MKWIINFLPTTKATASQHLKRLYRFLEVINIALMVFANLLNIINLLKIST